MNQDWEYGVLGDAVKKGSSNISLKKIKDDEGDFPVFSAKGFAKNVSFYQQESEYLSVIKDGAGIGRISKHPAKSSILATMQYIIPQNGFDIDFVKYFLSGVDFNKHRKGSTIPHVYFKDYRSEAFPLISLSEQKRIVAILDTVIERIDKLVSNTEKKLANIGEAWTSTLASACSGRLTKGWRQNNREIESSDKLLFGAITRQREYHKSIGGKFKEPRLPVVSIKDTVPKSWVWASPEQLSFHIVDCPHSTPKWANDGVTCLRTTNFTAGYLDLNSVRSVSESTYLERIKRLEPQGGDVLYSREGGILGISCVFPNGLRACLGQRMMLFRLDNKAVYSNYFSCVLNSPHILTIVNHLTAGAAAPHINLRDIRVFPIPLPPITEQQQIVTVLDKIWEKTQQLESIYQQKLSSLTELKQSILQKAFAGELSADSLQQKVEQ